MLHEERVPYETLKQWALESYYEGCRDLAIRAINSKWTHEQIVGYVSSAFEDGLDRPIENLMWEVILLVLSGGWYASFAKQTRQRIADLLAEHHLENLLVDVPTEEADLFRHDLAILKLI
jgi:hypothetical protein